MCVVYTFYHKWRIAALFLLEIMEWWICSKLWPKKYLQKRKLVLIDDTDSTTGLYLIGFDDPTLLPYVAKHSALSLSTLLPIPSNIFSYSVYEVTKKSTWYYTYTELHDSQSHKPVYKH